MPSPHDRRDTSCHQLHLYVLFSVWGTYERQLTYLSLDLKYVRWCSLPPYSLETKAVSDFKAARTGRPPDVCGWVRLLLLQEFQRLQPESTYSYCILKLHVLYFSPLPRIQTPGDLPSRLPTTHVSANRLEREVLVLLLSQVMNHKKPLRGLQSPSLHYPTLIPGGKYQRGKWILP